MAGEEIAEQSNPLWISAASGTAAVEIRAIPRAIPNWDSNHSTSD